MLLALAGLCGFAIYKNHNTGGYAINTVINGVDCSGLSASQAEKKLVGIWNRKGFKIVNEGKEIVSINKLDFEYDILNQLEKLEKKNYIDTILSFYGIRKNERNIKIKVKKQTAAFKKALNKVKYPVSGKKVKTRNAYLDMKDRSFNIVPEVYGNMIQKGRVREAAVDLIERGRFVMHYVESDYYKEPKILSTNKKLVARQKFCRKYLKAKIVLDLRYAKIEIVPKQLERLITVDPATEAMIANRSKVEKYVANLAPEADMNFNTAIRTYGRTLNQGKLRDNLIKTINSGKDRLIKVKFSGTSGGANLGGTYVEVDLSAQRMWLYIKGKQIVTTPVVTGNITENYATPVGTYSIFYMERNATLKGVNRDGSKYASPVSFWMPFNGGIGLHDAPWKSRFGDGEYLTHGSHGCINMPYTPARITFENVKIGTKVVVHQ